MTPRLRGQDSAVVSMGVPPVWRPYAAAASVFANTSSSAELGVSAAGGVYRDILNPMTGLLGVAGEGYAGAQGGAFQGGARLFAAAPVFFLQAGADYSATERRTDFILSLIFPVNRGGFLHRGGVVRLDWLPTRQQTFMAGIQFPLFQPWAGRTRQYDLLVRVPRPPAHPAPASPSGAATAEIDRQLALMREGARWLARLSFVFWDDRGGSYQEGIARAREEITAFKTELATRDSLHPEGHTFAREMRIYHAALDRAFQVAAAMDAAPDAARDSAAADRAQTIMFHEVIVPYDHNFGQYKSPETLLGFGALARAHFGAWLRDSSGVAPRGVAAALYAFDAWTETIEGIRTVIDEQSQDDPRLVWLPLQLALRTGDYDSQAKIEHVIEALVRQPFTAGNAVVYMDNSAFQFELARMILETRRYHVLWIHDYVGVNQAGEPDSIGWYQSLIYLIALTNAVRAYDHTGILPAYLIMADALFTGNNKGSLWLEMLERPLTRRAKLPARFRAMEREIASAQRGLRDAVASSTRLQADAATHGGQRWLEERVRVYVNVTFPSDLSFRTSHLLGLLIMPDNLIVDHRKIAFRDVTETDPAEGEAIYGGMGIGQQYASATWEDRALLMSGPALVSLKRHARETLQLNGFTAAQIPWFLRAEPTPADYAQRVARLDSAGSTARALETQNQTGFAQKDASIAQMALYNLMPAGSVMIVPSAMWTSALWASQLGSAALRGCHVYIVAPSARNSPSSNALLQSRQSEIFARLITMSAVLDSEIVAVGGALHIGIYDRDHDLAEVSTALRHVTQAFRSQPFLQEEFPFPPSLYAYLDAAADSLDANGVEGQRLIGDVSPRKPLLHRKTQFFGTRAVLGAIARDSGMGSVFRRTILLETKASTLSLTNLPVSARAERRLVLPLLRAYDGLSDSLRRRSVLFSAVGSINKDSRGVYLDGEVHVLLAGPEALWTWPDYFMLLGWCRWVRTVDEMDALVPPAGRFVRWTAYRVRRVL